MSLRRFQCTGISLAALIVIVYPHFSHAMDEDCYDRGPEPIDSLSKQLAGDVLDIESILEDDVEYDMSGIEYDRFLFDSALKRACNLAKQIRLDMSHLEESMDTDDFLIETKPARWQKGDFEMQVECPECEHTMLGHAKKILVEQAEYALNIGLIKRWVGDFKWLIEMAKEAIESAEVPPSNGSSGNLVSVKTDCVPTAPEMPSPESDDDLDSGKVGYPETSQMQSTGVAKIDIYPSPEATKIPS